MREHLYRGRIPMKGGPVWKEGYIVKFRDSVNIFEDLLGKGYGVEEETVGEYIQRTDKNGKKVFEGDIIFVEIDGIKEYFLVEYLDDNDHFGYCLRELSRMSINAIFPQKFFSEHCEVIGNRWDMTSDDLAKLGLIKPEVRHE